jgi:tRNA 2-thiouridine synthesizing protein A
MDDVIIDTRGLRCPLPLLRVRKAMRDIAAGTNVIILATDPGAEQDLRDYCEAADCAFLSADSRDGVLRAVIRTY